MNCELLRRRIGTGKHCNFESRCRKCNRDAQARFGKLDTTLLLGRVLSGCERFGMGDSYSELGKNRMLRRWLLLRAVQGGVRRKHLDRTR